MQKILIAYFTQGGSTIKIAKKISQGLQSKNHQVDFYNIVDNQPPNIKNYDIIGIGSPVYIFRPPFNVIDYLRGLPKLNDLPFFVFLLYGTKPGTAGNVIRKILSRKGGNEIGYEKFKGADYFYGYLQRGHFASPNNPSEDELKQAEQFGQDLVSRISEKDYIKPGMDALPPIVYCIERMITTKSQVRQIYSRFFKVDKEKCTSCKICVKECPKNNIHFDQNEYPVWGRECIGCFYCEMKCPTDAITSPLDWLIMAPFVNYNVSDFLKDPSIEKIKVVHKKGKIARVEE